MDEKDGKRSYKVSGYLKKVIIMYQIKAKTITKMQTEPNIFIFSFMGVLGVHKLSLKSM